MQLSLAQRLMAALLIFLPMLALAEATSTINSSVRALGMGDAFTALADDENSLFYNPAGLARVSGLNWKVFSIQVGASGLETYEKIVDLQSDGEEGFAEGLKELYGDHVYIGLGGSTIFTMPLIGAGIYNHTDISLKIDNPVNPKIYATVINDYGYTGGFGVPLGPFLQAGMVLRYVKRTGGSIPFGAGSIADLNADNIVNRITGWGVGYGMDLGMNIVIPAPFFSATLSGVWRNVGVTTYTSTDLNTTLPVDDNDMTLGAALNFDLPLFSIAPAIDIRYLNRNDLQLMRKLNLGIEIGIPLLDIRGGFREGYYSAGVGVNLGLFKVDAATYGVELGEYPGQIEDRRYVVEFAMDLGVGNFTVGNAANVKKGGGSGAAAGGKSNSVWGSRRLKQRR